MDNLYLGMTVNERLHASGQMDLFDIAVSHKDVDKVILILKKLSLSEESIIPILVQIGLADRPLIEA